MTHPLLEDTYRKLRRARKHLQDLRTEIADYVIGEPEGLASQFEPEVPEEAGRPGITVRVALQSQPSSDLALIAGDVIQNTRSALDYLANAVVKRNRGEPTNKTQFPILTDRLGDRDGIRNVEIYPRASKLANALVERLQPYYRTDDPTTHPLALLQELSNIDKHRRLHVVAGYTGNGYISFSSPLFNLLSVEMSGLAENGALVTFLPVNDPVYFKGMEVRMQHSIEVGLRKYRKGEAPLDALLDDLLSFVSKQVVDRFSRRVFRTPPPVNVLGL